MHFSSVPKKNTDYAASMPPASMDVDVDALERWFQEVISKRPVDKFDAFFCLMDFFLFVDKIHISNSCSTSTHFAREILKILDIWFFASICGTWSWNSCASAVAGNGSRRKQTREVLFLLAKGIPQGIPPPAKGKVIDTNHPWLGFLVISVRVQGFSFIYT